MPVISLFFPSPSNKATWLCLEFRLRRNLAQANSLEMTDVSEPSAANRRRYQNAFLKVVSVSEYFLVVPLCVSYVSKARQSIQQQNADLTMLHSLPRAALLIRVAEMISNL